MTTALALPPMHDIVSMAQYMARAKIFGKTEDQIVSLMLIAHSQGIHPAQAALEYDVIDGRPALKSQAVQARFQAAGGIVEWFATTDKVARVQVKHPQGGKVVVEWTIDRARQAGLAGKDNWRKYPEAMLRARAISEAVRACLPGCILGTYTPEEISDLPDAHYAELSPESPKDLRTTDPRQFREVLIASVQEWIKNKPEETRQRWREAFAKAGLDIESLRILNEEFDNELFADSEFPNDRPQPANPRPQQDAQEPSATPEPTPKPSAHDRRRDYILTDILPGLDEELRPDWARRIRDAEDMKELESIESILRGLIRPYTGPGKKTGPDQPQGPSTPKLDHDQDPEPVASESSVPTPEIQDEDPELMIF